MPAERQLEPWKVALAFNLIRRKVQHPGQIYRIHLSANCYDIAITKLCSLLRLLIGPPPPHFCSLRSKRHSIDRCSKCLYSGLPIKRPKNCAVSFQLRTFLRNSNMKLESTEDARIACLKRKDEHSVSGMTFALLKDSRKMTRTSIRCQPLLTVQVRPAREQRKNQFRRSYALESEALPES